jgi:hypothetical protein
LGNFEISVDRLEPSPFVCIVSDIMNQEEDEDAFLYGDANETSASTSAPAALPSKPTDQEMEPASEGEIDEEDEDEDDDDDSVHSPCPVLIPRTLNS